MNLTKVNNGSPSDIVLYNSEKDLEKIKNSPIGVIVAGDGMFYFQNNNFATIFTKINVPYKNIKLKELNVAESFVIPKIEKPDLDYFQYIIDCFKYINNQTNYELLINLYYSLDEEQFIIDIPPNQVISGGSDEYNYEHDFESDPNFVRYLQIHSHHKMGPTPSSTDNKDDQSTSPCFQGIVGNLDANTDVYSVSCTFRYWSGLQGKFYYVNRTDVFDYPKVEKDNLDESTMHLLDEIIKESKKQNQKNKNQQGNSTKAFENQFKNSPNSKSTNYYYNREEDSTDEELFSFLERENILNWTHD